MLVHIRIFVHKAWVLECLCTFLWALLDFLKFHRITTIHLRSSCTETNQNKANQGSRMFQEQPLRAARFDHTSSAHAGSKMSYEATTRVRHTEPAHTEHIKLRCSGRGRTGDGWT